MGRSDDPDFRVEMAKDRVYFQDKSKPKLIEIPWPSVHFGPLREDVNSQENEKFMDEACSEWGKRDEDSE